MQNYNFKKFILILLLAAISFSVYFNSLHGEFLIDDQSAILNDARVHNLNNFFHQHFRIGPGIFWFTATAINWHLSGTNPFAYHLLNVLLNTICVVLLFILCNALFGDIVLSFLSCLIFALHPIHTEAVSWISGGHYVLSSLFYLAAMIYFVKSNRSILNFVLAIFFFGLGLFSGNNAASLPIMFIFYELCFRKKDPEYVSLRKVRLTVIFAMLLISLVFMGVFFVSRDKFIHTIFYFRGANYLVVIAKAFAYYLKIIYLPIERGLFHPFGYNSTNIEAISPVFFVGLFILIAAVICIFRFRRSAAPISFGIAWFLITYLPYSNIIPICNIVSERYMYLPTAGFSIFIASLFLKAWKIINKKQTYNNLMRYSAIAAVTTFFGCYAILTVKHNFEYSNIITYWESNVSNFPDGYKAYNNLAGTFYVMGNKEQALAYSWVGLMIKPEQPHVWCNLAKVYREQGNLRDAEFCYRQALVYDKNFFYAKKGLEDLARLRKEVFKNR